MTKKERSDRSPRRRRKAAGRKSTFLRKALGLIILFFVVAGLAFAWRTNGQNLAGKDAFSQTEADIPVYTLIVGVDDEQPQQCNFVALAAVNKDKHHVDLIVLPDNTKIEGRKEKGPQTLASVYGEVGLTLLQAVVEDMFHVSVKNHIIFTQESFRKLMDMNGGMDMYVEKNMYHADNTGQTDINLFQGYQHLSSDEALGYMRYLDSDGDLARARRQLRFIKLFLTEQLKHYGLTNAVEIYRFWTSVDSDISTKDMAKLVYAFGGTNVSDFSFYILPGESSTIRSDKALDNADYWVYDPIEAQKLIGMTNNSLASDVTFVPERPVSSGEKDSKDNKDGRDKSTKDGSKKSDGKDNDKAGAGALPNTTKTKGSNQ